MTIAENIWKSIKNAKSVIITSHKSPDGDSIGSSMAMYHFLEKNNIPVSIVHPDPAPDFLHWVPGQEKIVAFENEAEKATELLNNSDLILCLDYNHPGRVGDDMQAVLENAPADKIMIDHHLNPSDFCKYIISKPEACSTAELVYEWIVEIGEKHQVDPVIGQCIYLGIMTDTGSFRFPSVTSQTHRVIADLIDAGVLHSDIHEAVYDNNTIDRIRLKGYCLSEKLVCMSGLPIAYASLTADELNKFNAQKGDTEGLVNQILGVQGIKMAVFFAEKDGKIKISFRSKGDFVVNELAAAHFGGGGHKYASGGISSESMDATINKFVTNVKDFIPVS